MNPLAAVALALVAIPVAGAGACRIDPTDRYGWPIAAATLLVTTALATWFAVFLLDAGTVTTRIVGDAPGPSVAIRSDAISATIGLLDALITLGVLAYIRGGPPRREGFYESYLLFTAAVFGVVLAGDLVVMHLALAVMILAAARLVASGSKPRSTAAARGYRHTALAATALSLVGTLSAAAVGGSTDATRLGRGIAEVGYAAPTVIVSFAFTTVGLAALVALVPLHGWLVDAHANASDPVSALVSGVLPAAAVYALARVLFDVYGFGFLVANPAIRDGILYGSLASLLGGNLLAYGQRDVKGMLAYSTVSQFGLIVAGLVVATETAAFGALLHVFGHGVVKGALCLVAGIFAIRFGARTIDEYAGLARRAPAVSGAFTALGVAMIGLPPTVGFVGKWYVAVGAAEEGLWVVAGAVVASTVLTLGYVLPFIDRLYFGRLDASATDAGDDVSFGMVAVVVAAAVAALVIGVAAVSLEPALRTTLDAFLTAANG